MDAQPPDPKEKGNGRRDPMSNEAFPETRSEARPSSPRSRKLSLESYHSIGSIDTDGDLSGPEMDSPGDAYRRKKALLMSNESAKNRKHKKTKSTGAHDSLSDGQIYETGRKDPQGSDFSSLSTSDDVELDRLASEDDRSDEDEETGLTKSDKRNRKRRRKTTTDLDSRIGGSITAKEEKKLADRKVLLSLLLNAALIASWYLFSLSISIVSDGNTSFIASAKYMSSIILGCFQRSILISTSHFSRPASICWYNSVLHRSYFISFPLCGRKGT